MIKVEKRDVLRERRHKRIRKELKGTGERPRLSVFISLKHIYLQLIDDAKGVTLTSSSTLNSELKPEASGKNNIEVAKMVGKDIALKIQTLGIKKIAFDRGGYKYHGKVKAIADSLREVGLEF